MEVFGWRYSDGGIRVEVFGFSWPDGGPVGGIRLEVFFGGPMVARLEVFIGPMVARLEVFGPVLARLEVSFWRYFTRWPGSGPTVRISRRYVGVENGAMNRKVRLFGSINAVT